VTTKLVPLDDKTPDQTLLAMQITSEPGAAAVVCQAVSRRRAEDPWRATDGLHLQTKNFALWEALLDAYETSQQAPVPG